jgi:hypothetical protein
MSAKSVADKLLIKPATTVWSSHPDRLTLLEPLPDDVRVVDHPEEAATAVVFGDDAQSLRRVVAAHAGQLAQSGSVWVAYPKGNRTDINRDSVWPILTEHGLRPIGQVALDDVWSALRFRPLKPGEAPFKGGGRS